MKSTLIKIMLAFIISWAALAGISKLYDFGLLQNLNIKASYIQKQKIDADILIHGPCQVLWMVQPSLIQKQTHLKIYNLGLTHADFADNYLHLYLYLKHNTPPKYLFLYISPESMDLNYNTFSAYRFASFTGDATVDSVLKECDSSYFKWINIPFMKYAYYNNYVNFDAVQGLKHFFTHKATPYYADGFEPPVSLYKKEKDSEEYVHIYPLGYRFNWDGLREKYLRKTIEFAKQKGIKVYLYESPVLSKTLPYLPNREETLKKIKCIADEYGTEYARFDNMDIAKSAGYYISDVITTFEGSVIFSDSLGRFINEELNKK